MLSRSLFSPIPRPYFPKPFYLSTNKPRLHACIKDQFGGDGNTSPEEPVVTPPGLRREIMPKHVAIIMDGNRRWARSRMLMPHDGHLAGAKALRVVRDLCCEWGIQVLSVYAFSSENLSRNKTELVPFMKMLENKLKDEIAYMKRKDIRLSVIGDVSRLPRPSLREIITHCENTTKNNSRLNLVIAINYGGKHDIIHACQSIARKVKDGVVKPDEITDSMIDNELSTNFVPFPHPDFLIRTSGEVRLSNFYLWQLAYTELYFTETLWPDFGEDELLRALQVFQERPRRFGV